ncbi:hypothetical protein QWY31_10665 [Cytophagales bacterium LB-30]|uniref:Uncharacterized protein n=1 Tax=Shiella aurantiaca TaxID=3058365 RepID=A0ABT8F7Q4_9BACT|nr:hypothetical protein [Shiella aurantiaca]MDN4165966.1 hypothetical protein [Shiella aurantiaca]
MTVSIVLSACGDLFEDEPCDIAPGISQASVYNFSSVNAENRWCAQVPFKAEISVFANYFSAPSNCGGGKSEVWTFPEGTVGDIDNQSTNAQKAVFFNRGGEVCMYVQSDDAGRTETFCQRFEVVKENVWVNINSPFINNARARMVSMVIEDKFYAGFGVREQVSGLVNDWYAFDTAQWKFVARGQTINEINFTALAGFAIGSNGYILGNNSKLYKYTPQTDQFTELSTTLPFNVITEFLVTRWDRELPVVGVAVNGKGYFGLGKTNRWFEFDPITETITEKAAYPGTKFNFPLYFEHEGKAYIGDKIYNPQTDTWADSPVGWINERAGHWLVFDDFIYVRQEYETLRISLSNGQSESLAEPEIPCFIPLNGKLPYYGVSGVIGNVGIVVTNRYMTTTDVTPDDKSPVFNESYGFSLR